jgi:hypothetical protein
VHVPLAPLLLCLLCVTVIAESLLGNRALRDPAPSQLPHASQRRALT